MQLHTVSLWKSISWSSTSPSTTRPGVSACSARSHATRSATGTDSTPDASTVTVVRRLRAAAVRMRWWWPACGG
ncbi:hypothetical protein F4560_000325 [Saccharothrix ecbatanensis]|uniref:Uncharacterized protein n=1 Tax=Saccharothrix ecbatanensis TaxID=1105145 RepID=A0A7W9HE26_9PSEU|nr:hypothetical protein [Saccharothrix ecbatanensis]MBB5800557.1 hypothetical protein [Saccharothrix ecbatanensis]